MSTSQEIWVKLSKINVNDHTEKKDKFTYLSWSWAWATLMENYPESSYEFRPDMWHPNGTCEVWVDLTVEGISRPMWLAVTNHGNKPVINPSCDMIANARMRCLVKAMAMFGLGHYIYAKESLPMDVINPVNNDDEIAQRQAALDDAISRNKESIIYLKEQLAFNDYSAAYEAWAEITAEDKQSLWVAPSKYRNAPFTTEERSKMKSNEMNEARKQFHSADDLEYNHLSQ